MSENGLAEEKIPVARIRFARVEALLYPGQVLALGRSADNDLVLDNAIVSRNHAVIEWNGIGFSIRDLGSINGTYVNGQLLVGASWMLRDGDEITIHDQRLVYEIIRAEAAYDMPAAYDTPAANEMPGPDLTPPFLAPRSMAETPPADEDLSPGLSLGGSRLVVAGGPDMGQVYPLWGEQIKIGRASRDATWEIRLSDRSVSRPHALVGRQGAGYYLVDLDSANGTLLNGSMITGLVALRDGDEIAVGETRLVFYTR